MNTTSQFLADLDRLGVKLWTEGDLLRYQASKGILTPELLSQLRDRKAGILHLLQNNFIRAKTSISPIAREENHPLSFAQKRLWFLNELAGKNAIYNVFLVLRLAGKLNRQALSQALQTILERHEVLSTSFITNNGLPAQIIAPNLELELPVVDLASLPENEREDRVVDLVQQEIDRPFDLAISPLFRAKLFRLSDLSQVLCFTLHHIITDGWSMGILENELSIFYQDFSTGRSPSLAPLPVQYIDFSDWQKNWLQGEVLAQQVNYWKTQLANTPPVLNLPTDKPRPAIQTFTGKQLKIQISTEISQQLKHLSQQCGATLFMTLLTAFSVLLSRYSHQADIVVGSPIANRNHQAIESLIGFFVNILALRINLQHNPSFRELLARVKEMCLDAYGHQDLPFEKLVEELHPERSLSYHPLFQTVFILQNTPAATIDLTDLTITQIAIDPQISKFDLTLSLSETPSGLAGYWEYNTDLFSDIAIERMSGHFQTLLAGIITDSTQSIAQLPLLTALERQQLLIDWNDTTAEYPREQCIHQLFEKQVARTPENIAIFFEDRSLTYRELNDRANRLAHYLQQRGVIPEVLVGIYAERSLETIISILGILKAGGAYVPLDPNYPQDRIDYIISNSKVKLLITTDSLLTKLSIDTAKVISLDTDWKFISQQNSSNLDSDVRQQNLAYVIYTSGSTGSPKGVLVEHQALVAHCFGICDRYQLQASDRVLQFASFNFDPALEQLFPSLMIGCSVVLRGNLVWSVAELWHQIHERGITVANLPTTYWQKSILTWQQHPGVFPAKLRLMIVGGEALMNTALPAWRSLTNASARSVRLINAYGPTEATITALTFTVPADFDGDRLPIGRPLANRSTYILDANNRPCPIGLTGELYIGGDCLARGYLDRQELTITKFIRNPFSDNPKSSLYRTGDLALYLSDGNIEFLGRIDSQVKIRGFRIELGEIESVLSQHSDISNAVAIAREDIPGDKRIIAYLVPHNGATLTQKELCQFLTQKVPNYMVPSVFIVLDKLPLTPNGKIDRQALPIPDKTRLESAVFVAPRNALELQLTQIWQKVLGIPSIGVRDNFFDLGGHSLLAIQLSTQIEKTFNINLPLAVLFQSPTVEQFASTMLSQSWHSLVINSPGHSLIPIKFGGSLPPLFGIHILDFKDLLRHLELDQPIYGLRYGIGMPMGSVTSCPQMQELADYYIDEMKSLQPDGPYFLMGHSFGGLVAYEMAQKLVAQGQQVALLALLDTSIKSKKKLLPFTQILSNLRGQGLAEFLKRNLNNYQYKIKKRLRIKKSPYCPHIYTQEEPYLIAKNYTPESYTGRVLLFTAKESHSSVLYKFDPPGLDWRKLVDGELEIYEIPGDHLSMIKEPNVQVLAQKLMNIMKLL